MMFTRFRNALLFCSILFLGACGGGGGGSGDSGSGNPEADDDGDGYVNSVDVDDDNDGLIEISTLQTLDWMRNDLAGTSLNDGNGNVDSTGCPVGGCNGYELVADLDFDTNGDGHMDDNDTYFDYDGPGSATGWLPIGDWSTPFGANFEGNGYHIRNLFIDRDATDTKTQGSYLGLFGEIEAGAAIAVRNLQLDGDMTKIKGISEAGTLTGSLSAYVEIRNVTTSGAVSCLNSNCGGLIGQFRLIKATSTTSAVVNSQATGPVSGIFGIGGLIGVTRGGSVEDCSTAGDVTTIATTPTGIQEGVAGGLIGSVDSTSVLNSTASGNVSSSSGLGVSVGGLVGRLVTSSLTSSTATGTVSGSDSIGGLVGKLTESTITDSHATGTVSGNYQVGGLVGMAIMSAANAVIDHSYATGAVSGSDETGGLLGGIATYKTGAITEINNSFSTGPVSGTNKVGGLIGLAYDAVISNDYATGNVVATGDSVGGLVGRINDSEADAVVTLRRSFATSVVTSTGSYVGGLAGLSYNLDVDDTFATGSVDGVNFVGGLIGDANKQTSITKSFAVNDVTGSGSVGSFVGWSDTATYESDYFSVSTTPANGIGTLHAGSPPTAGALNGLTTTQLKCPTHAADPVCTPTTIYGDWDSTSTGGDRVLWNYGTSSQLPGLILNGVVYRDADGNGTLD